MGSYGIGIERIVACHIEQSNDQHGIVWNMPLAPYQIHLVMVTAKDPLVVETSEALYAQLQDEGYEVLFDDRGDISPGFKFKDADLLGMPLQVIVGEKNLANGKIEVKTRKTGERSLVDRSEIQERVRELIASIA
jgi:prolyl-tRNA synthetase